MKTKERILAEIETQMRCVTVCRARIGANKDITCLMLTEIDKSEKHQAKIEALAWVIGKEYDKRSNSLR